MYFYSFARFGICKQFRLVSNPVDIQLLPRNALNRHLGITLTEVLFYKAIVVLVEL